MSTFDLEHIGNIFTDASVEVLSASTGLNFDISSKKCECDLDDMVSFLSLYGENNGMLFISASQAAARSLCASMTGTKESEVVADDVGDALCELTNMVAGNAKLRFNNAGTVYTLSPLFLITGKEMIINTKKRINVVSKCLVCDNLSIIVKVIFF